MPLPLFSEIRADQVVIQVREKLDKGRQLIRRLASPNVDATWQDIIEPMERFEIEFSNFWSPISHLWSVMNSPELSDAFQESLPLISDYQTELGQNQALFEKYKAIAESRAFAGFSAAQKKLVENALRDFHLSGVDLPEDLRDEFKKKNAELTQLQARFEQNLLDSGNAWQKLIEDIDLLKGIPESSLKMFEEAAKEKGQEGWLLTLDFPFFLPVMQYAEDRELRYEVYRAYNTRASEYGLCPEKWDNTEIINRIVALRHEIANLLSFQQFADLSLATKMAQSPDQVLGFLEELAAYSKTPAQSDMEELKVFFQQENPELQLEPWDIPFYSEKLRQSKFDFSSEDLRPYFPLDAVLDGLFLVVQRLFSVKIREINDIEAWHPDARLFEIKDDQGIRGQFYLDLYARPRKRGGAWMDTCQERFCFGEEMQLPVAFLICNFSPPVEGKPSLLTHEEVMTIFHEFGHGLHHMLTKIDYPGVGGINGVPWDAVELPSQFMENWCWQEEALSLFARHYESGDPFPAELLKKMKCAKNFQAGMQMVRQLEFAFFDFLLHSEFNPEQGSNFMSVLNRVREKVAVVTYNPWNRFPNSFHHVFGGGYAAGYYSYKWAEVLSADAFSLFCEKGIFDPDTGRSFLENILEKGGSEPAMNLFENFRGRPPQTEALLRDCGFIPSTISGGLQ